MKSKSACDPAKNESLVKKGKLDFSENTSGSMAVTSLFYLILKFKLHLQHSVSLLFP